jgi:HEPN domain-containing protein
LPRKTDSNNPADWLFIAESELEGLRHLSGQEIAHTMCRSKLAEVLEKVIKAELIRLGWFLEKTHDLLRLARELEARKSGLSASARPLALSLAGAYLTTRYPGFDLDDPDWPAIRAQIEQVTALLERVREKLETTSS